MDIARRRRAKYVVEVKKEREGEWGTHKRAMFYKEELEKECRLSQVAVVVEEGKANV